MNEIKPTQTFHKLITAYNEGAKLIVLQGGQGSGKTRAVMQLEFILAQKKKKRKITTTSYALPHLIGGAMSDLEKTITELGLNIKDFKKGDSIFNINNSQIEFVGLESNSARVTGNRRDILYVNEANNRIDYNTFDLAFARSHELTIIDFNPRSEFWYHEKIKNNFNHSFIKTTFLDNEYLPEQERENILSKKDKPGFENWWRVYGLGEIGHVEGAILTNWKYGQFDESLPFGYGLDFGSRDPDAMVKVAIDRNNHKIHVKEEIFQNNLSTDQLSTIIKSKNVGNHLIVADSAGTRTIGDLKLTGLNIIATKKGAGSVLEGIKLLQNYEIIVDENSFNLGKELMNWIWLDRRGEIPLDAENHLIDALRYFVSTSINHTPIHSGHKIITSQPTYRR